MFKNYIKIAFRQLSRNKVFSSLNILGLSLGMALVILIGTFIMSEFSYDQWMEESDRTYRVYRTREGNTSWTPGQLANKLRTEYPEIAGASGYSPSGERLLDYAGNSLYIQETARVDSTFFEVLGMDFLQGNPKTVLDEPNSMVITDQLSERIFGSMNPIGEVVKYDGERDMIITGVLNTKGKKTHINSEFFTRFRYSGNVWSGNNRATYVRLKPKVNKEKLAAKIQEDVNQLIEQELLARNYTPKKTDFYNWALQPLNEVYLYSEGFTALSHATGSIRRLYIFGIIGFLILLVAMINYVNLTTARASQRGKEIGVKKVSGAGKGMLTSQFLTESIVQTSIAGVIALIMAEIGLPFFNKITNRALDLSIFSEPWSILSMLAMVLVVGLLAGSYPAFIMSAFNPVTALKSNFLKTGNQGVFRKVLVTGQFAVSITLLIVMAFIYQQVNFMMEKDLGFQPDQVITIPMSGDTSFVKVMDLKEEFKQIPGVKEVTTASTFPGDFLPDWPILIEGKSDRTGPYVLFADGDFAKSLNIEMVEGRFIDDDIQEDYSSNFIVNERFVKTNNIKNPIGQKIKFDWQDNYGQIVGVMKDFHFRGLSEEIGPLVMNARGWRTKAGIKVSTTNMPETIAALKRLWTSVEPNHPMRYSFLDEEFAAQYAEQERFGETIFYSTLLTVFIALLGLFGLTTFTVERRTKEIGIRKVLGASVGGIVGLLAKDFVKLILFAALIAIPAAYLLADQWLADFAHRIDLAWWVFIGAGLLILLVAFLTVCLQSIKAALSNPVKSLRSE